MIEESSFSRRRLGGWFCQSVLMSVRKQLEAVCNVELVVDRRQMITERVLADIENAGDGLRSLRL